MKFFAFFDLEKLKKIFTALLLERSILVVSKDLENLTSCGLSLEYFMYPLEWLHTFVPIVPEHIDTNIFNQPFPFIYGTHTKIYEKLDHSQVENAVILLVDERKVINGERDVLPSNICHYLTKELEYFDRNLNKDVGNVNTRHLLNTGSIRPFIRSVLTIIDDYRQYLLFDYQRNEFRLDENEFFKIKHVLCENDLGSQSQRYNANNNEFYHQFRMTQSFEEVIYSYNKTSLLFEILIL